MALDRDPDDPPITLAYIEEQHRVALAEIRSELRSLLGQVEAQMEWTDEALAELAPTREVEEL